MRLFKRTNSTFQPVAGQRFADEHYERHLQEWLYNDLSPIAEGLLMLGKEIRTDDGNRIDLLALDKNGDAVIIELKRGDSPRTLVGQIGDYISSVKHWGERELEARTNRAPRTLEKEFRAHFKVDPPAEFNRHPRAVVVVEDIAEGTLATFKMMGVKVCKFSYLKSAEEEYLLVDDLGHEHPKPSMSQKSPKDRPATDPTDAAEWDAFSLMLNKVNPLIQDVFKSADGWRENVSRPDVAVSYTRWKAWHGFIIGMGEDDEGQSRLYIGLCIDSSALRKSLLAVFKKNENAIRDSLGSGIVLDEAPIVPIWEWAPNIPETIAARLNAYRDALSPYLDEALPTKAKPR